MPIRPIGGPPRPYVRTPYAPDTRPLGNIYARQGEMLAESQRQRGATAGNFWANLALAWNQMQAMEAQKAARAEAMAIEQAQRKEEQQIRAAEKAEAAAFRQQEQDQQAAIYAAEHTEPGPIDGLRAQVIRKFPGTAARLRLTETLPATEGPIGAVSLPDATGARTSLPGSYGAMSPEPSQFDVLEPTPQQIRQGQQDAAQRERDAQMARDREEDNRRQAERDKADADYRRESLAAQRARPAADEPLMAVIGDDGQPVYLPRSRAAGRRPASNREQGRPVTSGDAGRIAELDTSLDDVSVLRSAISGIEATGTRAYLGTKVPNWVTEITGWGADAKSKNAVIARVKQVIAKALEGGVLRKEDETKYKDILPTIGDIDTVVMDKINGLEKAIELRRTRELDAREDAGYDVAKFRERTRPSSDNLLVRMVAPNGQEQDVPVDQVEHYQRLGAKVKK